jgi:hypothetical protein
MSKADWSRPPARRLTSFKMPDVPYVTRVDPAREAKEHPIVVAFTELPEGIES